MSRSIIVQKYGGSSVATPEKLSRVAELVVEKKRSGAPVVVVVSAMGDTTDELLAKARAISAHPDRRELDMLLSVGERISMSLLAMAIRERGEDAVSLTGSQSGIITTASHANARIMEVRPFRIEDELEAGRIVIVAGYQGVSYKREVTTLGRGGSDTTAVALAAALDAAACEIYSDVDGVYSADPRVVDDARKLACIGYEEMQEMASSGAKVLNAAAVEFAKARQIAIYARRTGSMNPGTVVRRDIPTPESGVRGIAHDAVAAIVDAPTASPARARAFLERLAALEVHPKQIAHGRGFSCVIGVDDLHASDEVAKSAEQQLGPGAFREDHGTVSLIGEGITRELGVSLRAMAALCDAAIEPQGMSTSRFRISFVVPSARVKDAVRVLHAAFELGRAEAEAIVG